MEFKTISPETVMLACIFGGCIQNVARPRKPENSRGGQYMPYKELHRPPLTVLGISRSMAGMLS